MGHTNETPTLDLPQFVDSDKPTWRGDVNDAMLKVDQHAGSVIARLNDLEFKEKTIFLRVEDFGVVGDNIVDDTANLATAFAASAGKILVGKPGATYRTTAQLLPPANMTWVSRGSKFRKDYVSSDAAVKITDGFQSDLLHVVCKGGAGIDRAIQVVGSNIHIERMVAISETPNQDGGAFMGITLGYSGTGTWYENIRIDSIYIENWLNALMVRDIRKSRISDIEIKNFRTGVYMFRCQDSIFNGARISGTSTISTGSAGQNGLLVGDSASAGMVDGDVARVKFIDWTVDGAPEHAYRIGGDVTSRDITFVRCIARNMGNAPGNIASGGCGFKVLGVDGHRHINISFLDCIVEDGNAAAAGLDNHSGFNLGMTDKIVIRNPIVRAVSKTYAARHGIIMFSVADVIITSPDITGLERNGLRIVGEATNPVPTNTQRVRIDGGRIGSLNNWPILFDAKTLTLNEIELNNVKIVASPSTPVGLRMEPVGAGGVYSNIHLRVSYLNIAAAGAEPALITQSGTFVDYRGPVYGYGITAENGSVLQDTTAGAFKIRKAGAWVTL